MKRIVYTRSDGGLSIIIPVISQYDSEQQAVVRAFKNVPKDATNVRIVESVDLIRDRTFRNAWRDSGTKIEVDMSIAREIHMERIRRIRDEKLKALDIEWIIAMGKKDQSKSDEVEIKRQILRDIPQTIKLDIAQTPDELKAIWPPELLDNK